MQGDLSQKHFFFIHSLTSHKTLYTLKKNIYHY